MSDPTTIARPSSAHTAITTPVKLMAALARIAAHRTHPEIEDGPAVAGVLAEEPELVELICEALDQVELVFGDHASIRLEVFLDSEEREPVPCLYLVLCCPLDVDEGMRLLDDLHNRWWLRNSARASGLLAISLDFV